MTRILCLFAVMIMPVCAENLMDNSTMDTAGGWKGSKKIAKDEAKPDKSADAKKPEDKENRILIVSAKKREAVSFSQEVASKGLTDLDLKFRYRTKDYTGRGLEVRGVRQTGGSTFMNYTLVADGKWHEIKWKFNQVSGSNKINFVFAVLEGEGDVDFDDIIVESIAP